MEQAAGAADEAIVSVSAEFVPGDQSDFGPVLPALWT
jgi:hypothetical protein